MRAQKIPLSPPTLDELAAELRGPLAANYGISSVDVVTCPDLRQAPFHLSTQGLCGMERVADIGGLPNLYPQPRLGNIWSMLDIAEAMEMASQRGSLIGAGAGPFNQVGQNCELVPDISWDNGCEPAEGFKKIVNHSNIAEIDPKTKAVSVSRSPSECSALMLNLFGSLGEQGPVLRIRAQGRTGTEKSFTDCIQKALASAFGDSRIVSLGGVVLVKRGTTRFHVMPDFPSRLPFNSFEQMGDWLTYHDFDGPMLCLSVMHSADPGKRLGLRMEHTHGYSPSGANAGGHYHYDLNDSGKYDSVEYEAYFNTARVLYRIEQPDGTVGRDLHG